MDKWVALLAVIIVVLAGCVKTNTQSYGPEVAQFQKVTVKDMFSGRTDSSQTVMVEGKITTECPAGCWFYLDDGTGSVYVSLPDFIIPQITGARVRVYGTFRSSDQPPQINTITGQVQDDKSNTLSGKRVEVLS